MPASPVTPRRRHRQGPRTPVLPSPSTRTQRRDRALNSTPASEASSPSVSANPIPVYNIESRSPSPSMPASEASSPSVSANPIPVYNIESRSPSPSPAPISSPTPAPPPENPPPYVRHQGVSAAASPSRAHTTYAVRIGSEGEAYADFQEARVRYQTLLRQGRRPGIVVARSLSRAITWIEQTPDPDGGRALHRQAILDALDIYRAEQSDSDLEGSDEPDSDNSRATEDLELELDAHTARAEWRRQS